MRHSCFEGKTDGPGRVNYVISLDHRVLIVMWCSIIGKEPFNPASILKYLCYLPIPYTGPSQIQQQVEGLRFSIQQISVVIGIMIYRIGVG